MVATPVACKSGWDTRTSTISRAGLCPQHTAHYTEMAGNRFAGGGSRLPDDRDQAATQRRRRGCQAYPEGQDGAITQTASRGCKVDPGGQVGFAAQRLSWGCIVYPSGHTAAGCAPANASGIEIIAANAAATRVLIAITRGSLSVDGHGMRRSAAVATARLVKTGGYIPVSQSRKPTARPFLRHSIAVFVTHNAAAMQRVEDYRLVRPADRSEVALRTARNSEFMILTATRPKIRHGVPGSIPTRQPQQRPPGRRQRPPLVTGRNRRGSTASRGRGRV
jgi:hypothetical protein